MTHEHNKRWARPQAIGIDFGTANTAASALYGDGEVRLIELDPGSPEDPNLLKSLLYFPNRNEAFFGQQAIDRYFERDMEGRFLQSIKRLLPNSEFQGTVIHGRHVSVEDLVARFLQETRARIEKAVGSIEGIPLILGRPARYSLDPGREGLATVRFKKACDQSGLAGYRLMEEPVAAALTYPSTGEEETILVADLGGGTSDFTLMHLGGKSGNGNRALAVHGIPVAGDALDSSFVQARLVRHFGSEIRYQRPFSSNVLTLPTTFVRLLPKWHHHAFLKEKSTWNFLKTLHQELVDPNDREFLDNLITLVEDNLGYVMHQKVEHLKCELSGAAEAQFSFRSHPIRIEFGVSLAEFEKIIEPEVNAILKTAQDTLRMGNVRPEKLDAIYFTGGTSRVPRIRNAIRQLAPQARIAEKETFTSVASGLAWSHIRKT